MYYRCCRSLNPMSDWGHAMFAESRELTEGYGEYEFIYEGISSVDINDLSKEITDAWNRTKESCVEPLGFEEVDSEEIMKLFNPDNICNSAGAWDCYELLSWFCEQIAIPMGIRAVTTCDGAVVFDESLIKYVGNRYDN